MWADDNQFSLSKLVRVQNHLCCLVKNVLIFTLHLLSHKHRLSLLYYYLHIQGGFHSLVPHIQDITARTLHVMSAKSYASPPYSMCKDEFPFGKLFSQELLFVGNKLHFHVNASLNTTKLSSSSQRALVICPPYNFGFLLPPLTHFIQ